MRECDLCGLDCGKHPLTHCIADADRSFCCLGCLNVFVILSESGVLASGQNLRETEIFKRSLELGLISRREGAARPAREKTPIPPGTAREELLLSVTGMWCSSCAWLIGRVVTALPGVVKAEVSFASDTVKVTYQPQYLPSHQIVARINSLGYRAQRHSDENESAEAERRDLLVRTGLAFFLWLNIMTFSLAIYVSYFQQIAESVRHYLPFMLMVLATPVVFYCAQPILRLAWRGLVNLTVRMETLLSLGILAAYFYSSAQAFRGESHVFFDTASAIVALVLAGKSIERGAKERTTRWLTQLHRVMPNKARIVSQGQERLVNIEALQRGQIFVVKAGERIPSDGIVREGEAHADESLLTGESQPIAKYPGCEVVAGSVNADGILRVEAIKPPSESSFAQIIQLVEKALAGRSNIERAVDRVSRVFVPAIVAIALATFVVCWTTGIATPGQSLMRSITVLVIACPCALGLATPLAIMAAIGTASRNGILVTDSRVLETLAKVNAVVLDKTGTVTEGRFSLLDHHLCDGTRLQPMLASCPTVDSTAEDTPSPGGTRPPPSPPRGRGRENQLPPHHPRENQLSPRPLGGEGPGGAGVPANGSLSNPTWDATQVSTVAASARMTSLAGPHRAASADERWTEALARMASLEAYSEHPLGRALGEFARRLALPRYEASGLTIHKGQGITGRVDGQEVFLGNRRLAQQLGACLDGHSEELARAWEQEGKTVVLFGCDGQLQGLLAFGDKVRDDAPALTAQLQRKGVKVHLVSGDSRTTTSWVASRIGADSYRAECLPHEKIEIIRELQGGGSAVAMVGDGINDAPALAQANLGIAMGSGTDIAMKAASVVLMNNSLSKVIDTFTLAQKTIRIIRQNLFWAFFYNTAGITLAVAGVLNPILAAAAMLLSSVSVVGNSLRLTTPKNVLCGA